MDLFSTGLRTAMLGTQSLKAALANGLVHVYASAPADIPLSADAAIDPAKHTKLLTVYGDGTSTGLNLGTASSKAVGKSGAESWSGTVLTTGTAAFFRFVGAGDTGAASTTENRLQGRVGTSGAALNIDSLNLTAGDTRPVDFVAIRMPEPLFSTGLCNKVLDTGSLKSTLDGGFLHVYASAVADVPATADAAIDATKHTKIMTFYGDGSAAGLNFGAADAGAIGKDIGQSWSGTVLATGTPTFFRFVSGSDTGAASTTDARIQGRVGVGGTELNISSLSLTSGQVKSLNYFSVALFVG